MSTVDTSGSVCEKCGANVTTNEEGRVTCTGCNMATDNCTCGEQTQS